MRLPKNLRGPFGAKTTTTKNLAAVYAGFTTTTISVVNTEMAMDIISEWGNTLPWSGYSGFFRVIIVTRQQGLSFRSVSPYLKTLAEAASYILDFPIKFDNPDYDEVIGVEAVYLQPQNEPIRAEKLTTPKKRKRKKSPPRPKRYKDKNGRISYRDSSGKFASKPDKKKRPRRKR